MKRVIHPLVLLALLMFGSDALAATPPMLQGVAPNKAYGRVLTSTDSTRQPLRDVSRRSLAATSFNCTPWYTTNVYASVWLKPTSWPTSWYERTCGGLDETWWPGELYVDTDYYFWTGSAWRYYGTWHGHVTTTWGWGEVQYDYCYWQASGTASQNALKYVPCP